MDTRMESLVDEIIMDILSRAPTLDLPKLRYVCKRWNNILKDPLFRRLHRSHCMPNVDENRVLILRHCFDLYMVDMSDKLNPRQIVIDLPPVPRVCEIIGSCNGLLCLGSKKHKRFFIMNPFTRQLVFFSMNLKDNLELVWSWGFGFDEINKSYKLVVFVATMGNIGTLQLRVCDLGSDGSTNWRNIVVTACVTEGPACSLNGRLHWPIWIDQSYSIISFDLANEVARLIRIPDCLHGTINGLIELYLVVLGGCLCISYSQGSKLRIWAMKEYGIKASWAKILDARPRVNKFPRINRGKSFFRVVGSVKDGELVVLKSTMCPCEGAILFSDSIYDELKHLQLGRPLHANDSIIHTVSLNWI